MGIPRWPNFFGNNAARQESTAIHHFGGNAVYIRAVNQRKFRQKRITVTTKWEFCDFPASLGMAFSPGRCSVSSFWAPKCSIALSYGPEKTAPKLDNSKTKGDLDATRLLSSYYSTKGRNIDQFLAVISGVDCDGVRFPPLVDRRNVFRNSL